MFWAYPGIFRTYSEHIPNIFRAYPGIVGSGIVGHEMNRVSYRPSPVSPSRMARCYRIARCRIACRRTRRCGIARRRARREGWASRAVWPVAGSCAVGPVARSRLVMSRPVSATSGSLPWSRSGEPNTRRLPCPGPTAPVTDAAAGGLRTSILLHVCRVQSWFSRRRG